MPAEAAARAAARSPSGQNKPASPVGPTTTGKLNRWPKRLIERSRSAAPFSGRGRNCQAPKANSLRRRVVSSSAPPSAKSKTGSGNTRRAASRISAILAGIGLVISPAWPPTRRLAQTGSGGRHQLANGQHVDFRPVMPACGSLSQHHAMARRRRRYVRADLAGPAPGCSGRTGKALQIELAVKLSDPRQMAAEDCREFCSTG